MGDRRQKIQLELAFSDEPEGEAPRASGGRTESLVARPGTERPASTDHLMEEVCQRENLRKAYRRVKANKGSPGVDGMTVSELGDYLAAHGEEIRSELLGGTYRPQPVRRVEIPKPSGGKRKLGIPTVLDRFVQQAVLQVLQGLFEPTFSEHSYGFRPGRSAHQAVAQAQRYVAEGHGWVVDLDLDKFFDRVNHDRLMARIARRVGDKRLLRLIRGFLSAGVMEDGLERATEEGTPQGGPLSPLLSNIVLDELDWELERRGHRFVRYADDCNIYVRSERAGQRVMASVSTYITKKLKLEVNQEKSAVGEPWERKLLGFRFVGWGKVKRGIAPASLVRLKERVRGLTRRNRGISLEEMARQLGRYVAGWREYYGFCETPEVLKTLDAWIRRRLRSAVWRQWKHGYTRYAELRKLGVPEDPARIAASGSQGPWHASHSKGMQMGLNNGFFQALGLSSLWPGKR